MQTAIHDPYADATPYMRKEAAERRARLERLHQIVPRLTKSIVKAIEVMNVAVCDNSAETWEERQRRIHGKKLWFSIDAEIAPQEPRRPQVEHIQEVVAKNYNVTRDDILSARRQANVVRPRMIAVYLAKTLTLKSLPEIGRRFGNRDHTTILHSTRKIDQLCKTDPIFKSHVDALTAAILERC